MHFKQKYNPCKHLVASVMKKQWRCCERQEKLNMPSTKHRLHGYYGLESRSPVFLERNMNAQEYFDNVSEPVTIPYVQELDTPLSYMIMQTSYNCSHHGGNLRYDMA